MFGLKKELSAVRYSLFITEQCDKYCSYCDIPLLNEQKDSQRDLIYQYLPLIDQYEFESYTLTGGEPAMSSNLDLIFHIITKKIKVNTNGMFIYKGYFEKYYNQIDEIGLHPMCSMENLKTYAKNTCKDEKVTLYMPFNNRNWFHIPKILEDNPNITFNFIPYIYKKQVFDDSHNIVTLENMRELWRRIKDFDNVQASSMKWISKISSPQIDHYRLFCQNSNVRYLFDFVRGKIYRCAKSRVYNDYTEMTTENIERAGEMRLFESKGEFDISCKECYYFAYFFPYAVRNHIMRNKNVN